ncbi:unnamed protein product [Ambrosiozyma monospora]|uniref:Unnamed protein product n=1 Tax=Ambrosiozyma monospora TaxID=43982 RepID=A0A9W6YVE8_AMBMO|nr:unnamed protein product [Ambrosiozyma monospora]
MHELNLYEPVDLWTDWDDPICTNMPNALNAQYAQCPICRPAHEHDEFASKIFAVDLILILILILSVILSLSDILILILILIDRDSSTCQLPVASCQWPANCELNSSLNSSVLQFFNFELTGYKYCKLHTVQCSTSTLNSPTCTLTTYHTTRPPTTHHPPH